MIKFADTDLVFREVPDEITLAINITGCPHRCKGCHSPHLQTDTGEELTAYKIDKMLEDPKYSAATCVAFMGGDGDIETLLQINSEVKKRHPEIKTCWYTGFCWADIEFRLISGSIFKFDYVKIGPYMEELGPIDNPKSNQIMLKKIGPCAMKNITKLFRKTV